MAEPNSQPSETSPLLPKGDDLRYDSRERIVPEDADPNDYDEPEDEDAGDIEGQSIEENQDDGNPEVLKQLTYLMPALGIGIFLAAADQTIIVSSYGRIGSELNALSRTSWIATA
jgi:hypothetical protein